MRRLALFTVLLAGTSFLSCNNEAPCEDCMVEQNNDSSVQENIMDVDTQLVNVSEIDTAIMNDGVDQNFKENKKKIEEKFGEQWDFCTCVIRNDSVNKAIQNGADLNERFMARMDMIESKCQAFLTMSMSSTPEDRAKHEEKIANCLKAAKK